MMYSEAFNHSPACHMMKGSTDGKVFCICIDDVSKSVLVPRNSYHKLFSVSKRYAFIPAGDFYVFAVYNFNTGNLLITESIVDAVNYWDIKSSTKSLYYIDILTNAKIYEVIQAQSVTSYVNITIRKKIEAAVEMMYAE